MIQQGLKCNLAHSGIMKRLEMNQRCAELFDRVRRGSPRALLLDYDGTLAPFRVERDRAFIDPRLRTPLQAICELGRTRVVIISGRAIADLKPLVELTPLPELWGSHGWERLTRDGRYHAPDLTEGQRTALHAAVEIATAAGLRERCEIKPAGVALHWRGLPEQDVADTHARAVELWSRFRAAPSITWHEFDGGVELRAAGCDKGTAVARILRDLPEQAGIAYAGDDTTDEDAFRMLAGRGLGVLVRPTDRDSAADVRFETADEWEWFLHEWMTADREGGGG